VRQALGGRLLNVGFVPALPSTDPLEPVTARARVPHVWEITVNTTNALVQDAVPWQPEYLALDEVADTTAGLTRPGIVRLALPREQVIHAPANDVRSDPEAGVGDRGSTTRLLHRDWSRGFASGPRRRRPRHHQKHSSAPGRARRRFRRLKPA
jgi:hypothetical protein